MEAKVYQSCDGLYASFLKWTVGCLRRQWRGTRVFCAGGPGLGEELGQTDLGDGEVETEIEMY
jgi:hypothetical protein